MAGLPHSVIIGREVRNLAQAGNDIQGANTENIYLAGGYSIKYGNVSKERRETAKPKSPRDEMAEWPQGGKRIEP
jgi:hypothetical protein